MIDKQWQRDHLQAQVQELAQIVVNQAQALADGKIPDTEQYAHVKRLHNNTDTLLAWTKGPNQ